MPTLISLREQKNYSREKVAAETGASVNSVRNWETDPQAARMMSFEKAVKLADCLGISTDNLWKMCKE